MVGSVVLVGEDEVVDVRDAGTDASSTSAVSLPDKAAVASGAPPSSGLAPLDSCCCSVPSGLVSPSASCLCCTSGLTSAGECVGTAGKPAVVGSALEVLICVS